MMDYFIAFIIIVVAIFLWDWFEKPNEKHSSKEEIALAEFLEKRQEINQLFLVAKSELRKFERKQKP